MGKPKLVCKQDWIEVVPIPEGKIIGRGAIHYIYKHRALKDDLGQPYCGRTQLSEDDVEYANPVEEEAFQKAVEDAE